MKEIKFWDYNINFFYTARILPNFYYVSINKFKNLFFSSIDSNECWLEVEKMFKAKLIGFSSDFIYRNRNNFNTISLSTIFFNAYLNELDNFISYILNVYSIKKNIYFKNSNFNNFFKKYINLSISYKPLNIENPSLTFFNLKDLYNSKLHSVKSFFSKLNLIPKSFKRCSYYVRYLDNILLGFISSEHFISLIRRKILAFLNTNLQFSIKEDNVFSSLSKNILFCSFNIQLSKNLYIKDNSYFTQTRLTKKYLSRILFRLRLKEARLLRIHSRYFYYELYTFLNDILNNKNYSNFSFIDKKIWLLIFQLEAVRNLRFNKLVLINNLFHFISKDLFYSVKLLDSTDYIIYSFSLYIKKLQLVLKDSVNLFSYDLNNLTLPLDTAILNFILEFKKKLYFFYTNLYFDFKNSSFFFLNKYFSFKTFSNQTFYDHPYAKKKDLFIKKKSNKLFVKLTYPVVNIWNIVIPISFCYEKLKEFGFIHCMLRFI